jgi:hypothetical protein
MTIDQIFHAIEAHDFAARLSVASSRDMLVSMFQAEPCYRGLLTLVKKDPRVSELLVQRIKTLSELEFDPNFQNPHDIALAAYTYALRNDGAISTAYISIAFDILTSARDVWWTPRIAELIAAEQKSTTATNATTTSIQIPVHDIVIPESRRTSVGGRRTNFIEARNRAPTVGVGHIGMAIQHGPVIVARADQSPTVNFANLRFAVRLSSFSLGSFVSSSFNTAYRVNTAYRERAIFFNWNLANEIDSDWAVVKEARTQSESSDHKSEIRLIA